MIVIARKKRTRRLLDLTPLIDVVFQLLIFFVLTATTARFGAPLRLPEMSTAEMAKIEAVVISIDADGVVTIDGQTVPAVDLGPSLRAVLSTKSPKRVAVRGDVRTRYGLFMRVLDACRAAGIADVLLEAEVASQNSDEGEHPEAEHPGMKRATGLRP